MKINGIEAGFKFNNYAFEHFPFIKGVETFNALGVALIYCGYCGWCYARQKDQQLTFENIVDWIDSKTDEEFVLNLIEEIKKTNLWKSVLNSIESGLKKNEPQLENAVA